LGVEIITGHGLDSFDGSTAQLGCVYTQNERQVRADAILLVTTRSPADGLYREIAAKLELPGDATEVTPTLHKIGDCDAPAIIAAAVYAGHRYARELEADVNPDDAIRQDRLYDPDPT